MKKPQQPINIILLFLGIGLLAGCETTKIGKKKEKEEYTTFRMHLEVVKNESNWVLPIDVYPDNPQRLYIHSVPFIDERNVTEAKVIDDIREIDGEQISAGKAIGVKFDRTGKWLLESTTTSNRGRRIAIHSFFPEGRWITAKVITRPLTEGVIAFTPDATPEEMQRIVDGLNAVSKKLETKKYW